MPEIATASTGSENAGAAATSTATTPTTPSTGSTTPATPAAASTPSSSHAAAVAALEKASGAASSAEGGATGRPASTTGTQGTPDGQAQATGEDAEWLRIPEARRNTILQNTRTKAREEAVTEYKSKYGWAEGVAREDVQSAFGLAQQLTSNPVAFVANLIAEIRQDPRLAGSLDQALSGAVRPATAAPNAYRSAEGRFTLPKPKLVADDGKTAAFSSDQVTEALEQFEGYLMEKFGSRLSPLEEQHAAAAEREEVAGIIHNARQESSALMTEMRALAHWPKGGTGSEGEKKIAQYLGAIPREVRAKIGAVAAMYQAYNTFVEKEVLPTLRSSTAQQVQDDNRRRATAAAGSIVPGATVPQPPAKRPSNVSELARDLERRFAATS